MTVGIFLEYNGKVVQFPVNPTELSVTTQADNETVTTISLGQINKLATAQLKEVTFQSFFNYDTSASYVIGKNKGYKPAFFVKLIRTIMTGKKPCRLVISDCGINFLASIESFEEMTKSGCEKDVYYTITFKEFRNFKAKFVEIKKPPKRTQKKVEAVTPKQTQEESTNKQVTIGCTVIVNGRLHRDSYGSAPGQTEKNATRKVNFINMKGSHPYHVTTMNGGWRGWVTADSVVVQ